MSDKDPSETPQVGDVKDDTAEEENNTTEAPAEDTPKSSEKKGKKKDSKFTYRDYSHIEPTHAQPGTMSPSSSAIRVQKLPAKLNAMLSNPEFQHIISWMPHGRSWKVHNPHAFVEEVIPKYFEYTNYNSFVRLVNAWGFRRITKGPDRNSYYHELFLRGMPHLHSKMHRLTANEKKLPVDPEDEPDFYKISALCPLPPASHASGAASLSKGMAMAPLGPNSPRNPLLQKQMMAKQMGAGLGMGGLGGAGMMGAGMAGASYHDLAAARMGGVNPMMAAAQLEEEELALAAAGAGAGYLNPSLSQQRADLLAANQAYELQAARLREQERRLAYLSGGAGTAAAGALGGGLGYPAASMGRLGRGMGMMPEEMLGDPAGLGQSMSPAMMARLQGSQVPKGAAYQMNRF